MLKLRISANISENFLNTSSDNQSFEEERSIRNRQQHKIARKDADKVI